MLVRTKLLMNCEIAEYEWTNYLQTRLLNFSVQANKMSDLFWIWTPSLVWTLVFLLAFLQDGPPQISWLEDGNLFFKKLQFKENVNLRIGKDSTHILIRQLNWNLYKCTCATKISCTMKYKLNVRVPPDVTACYKFLRLLDSHHHGRSKWGQLCAIHCPSCFRRSKWFKFHTSMTACLF